MSGKNETKIDNAQQPAEGKKTNVPSFITLNDYAFQALFPLLPNHLNSNACWTYGDNPGCMFETYGEEHEFVRQQDPRTIWTIMEDGGDETILYSGYRLVNRIGYLISTNPVPEGVTIQVDVST